MKTQKIGFAVGIFILLAALASTAQAQFINTAGPTWTGTASSTSTRDMFFNQPVFAYRTGTTATLIVTVTNDGAFAINVTKVSVFMDWGTNYTSTQASTTSPVTIGPRQMGVNPSASFIITFTVPDTTTASNLFVHSYSFIAEFTVLSAPTSRGSTSLVRRDFAVYSTDMADDVALMQKLPPPLFTSSPCAFGVVGGVSINTFKTAEANSLCIQAASEVTQGNQAYTRGDFAGAKTHLQTANDLWSKALSTEASSGSATTLGGAVWGWGILLIGIAAIIGTVSASFYLMRKRGPRPSTVTATP